MKNERTFLIRPTECRKETRYVEVVAYTPREALIKYLSSLVGPEWSMDLEKYLSYRGDHYWETPDQVYDVIPK